MASLIDTLTNFWKDVTEFAQGGDTLEQAALRARGIDPATGKPLGPQYASIAQGVNQSQVMQQTQSDFTSQARAEFEQLGGVSILPFSPVIGGDAQNPLGLPSSATSSLILLLIVGGVVLLVVVLLVD